MAAIELVVAETAEAAEAIRLVTLTAAVGALPGFAPGAHVEVHLPGGGTRPYSLIDFDGTAAAPAAWHLGVRLEPEGRGGSAYMHGLTPGDRVRAEPPENDFPLAGAGEALLIAGGIGVTPLVSMATALKAAGRPYRLVYAARSRAAAAFAARLAGDHGARFRLHCDDAAGGPLDLAAALDGLGAEAHVHVCGPRPMMEAARAAAEARGLAPGRLHVELFDAAPAAAGDAPFEVEIASTGKVYTIPPGRSIIEVLEEGGEDLVYDCQRGDCGICQTGVLEGEPDHRDVVLSEAERASGTVMQICVGRARSPRLKLDL